MKKAFLTYLKNTIRIPEKSGVLLAVSGGVDSMTMLQLFENTTFNVVVAHCNFFLRGSDSDGDERMIAKYCEEKGIVFKNIKFKTLEEAKKRKISTQMVARELRYEWFDKLLKEEKLDFIATAHHAEDSFETALLNLTRGTGISGLKGILPKSGNMIRPILFAEKQAILTYANKNNIPWREDSSNTSDKYKRNFVRHQVLPLLQKLNPKMFQGFLQTGERVSLAFDFLRTSSEKFIKEKVHAKDKELSMALSDFFNPENRAMIDFWLDSLNFNYSTISSIFRSQEYISGTQFLSSSRQLLIDRDKVIILPFSDSHVVNLEIDEGLKELDLGMYRLRMEKNRIFPTDEDLKNPNRAFLNYTKLKFPLTLRNWRKGDSFNPFGMKGNKLVSDFLIDEKVPLHLKKKTLVLCSGDEVVWILGHRIADGYKVEKADQEIVKFVYQPA